MKVREVLNQSQVEYETLTHPRTCDAARLAEAVDESGHHVAKTVLLKTEQGYLLAVLPATHVVDLPGIQQILRTKLELASESELVERFPDCETGAVPPFGSWYGMSTVVDESLADHECFVFESNTHSEAIRIRFEDYFELEKPVITSLSYPDIHGTEHVTVH